MTTSTACLRGWENLRWGYRISPCSTIHFITLTFSARLLPRGRSNQPDVFTTWRVVLYAHTEKCAYVLGVMVSHAGLTACSLFFTKLEELQGSFSSWSHRCGSCSQGRLLPAEFLSIFRNNKPKTERWSHLSSFTIFIVLSLFLRFIKGINYFQGILKCTEYSLDFSFDFSYRLFACTA